MSEKCLFVTTHYCPLVGGAQTVYDALARSRPDDFAVLTGYIDYATGLPVDGWRHFDQSSPYRITRIPEMRPPMLMGKPGFLAKTISWLRARLIWRRVSRAVLNEHAREGFQTICIGALDSLGWLVEPLRANTSAKIVLYTHGEEISQIPYSQEAETRRGTYLRDADGVVAVSSFTRDLIMEKYGVDGSRIGLVSNGVDLARFKKPIDATTRQKLGLTAGPLVLSLGRLVPRKGFDKLLEAWPEILASVPGAQLAIAGKGPLEADFADRAGAAEMQGSVTMLGHVVADLLPSLYATADLFVMPNRTMPDGDTEGFGLVFLEAAAAGTPSVAGRAGGAVDAVIDGTTGAFVDGENVAEIAETVANLLLDDVGRNALARAAKAHAETQCWAQKADDFLAFIDRLPRLGGDAS